MIAKFVFGFCLFLKAGEPTPRKTLDDVLTKLSLISNEHEHIMAVLQELSQKVSNVQSQCGTRGELSREIVDTLQHLKKKLEFPNEVEVFDGSGATYVRWGRSECESINGTVKIYDGFAAGDFYNHAGGPSELLCLPKEPSWGKYDDEYLGHAFIYGTEYQTASRQQSVKIFGKHLEDENVPCVVCQSIGRMAALRVPGRTDCFTGWTREYTGYLMGGHHGHKKSTDYTCIDSDPEVVEGSARYQEGRFLYFVEANCYKNSLPCPPYVHGREIPCVVCTK